MKKIISIIAVICALCIAFAACGQTTTPEETAKNSENPAATQNGTKPDDHAEPGDLSGKVIVAVFSATGTTKGVAEKIAALTGAELKEIVPAVPYTSADLNYGNSGSRATKEQNDADARPQLAGDISIEGCRVLYLGYPIWWGEAPRIMSTFVESHDFTGITVIPFCTSGSSDIGSSDDTLAAQAGSGNWLQGKRFPGSVKEDELREWIAETGGIDMEKTLKLYIGDTEIPVEWEDNGSVNALKKLAEKTLTVQMSMYGGFEQVGALGSTLPRDDRQTTTEAGDIVLYSGNQIVIFYGSNSWSYTRLGHASLSEQEMTELLSHGDVNITLKFE